METIPFSTFMKRISAATPVRSQAQLAQVLGVHRSAVSQAKRNDAVPFKWILSLAGIFGLRVEWLATGRGRAAASEEPELRSAFTRVPKVAARLSAGGGSFETEGQVREYFLFKRDWLRRKGNPDQMVLMDICGNSMEPELRDGDTILVDRSRTEVLAGAIYAVGIEDTIMVKRLERQPNNLVLLSDNAHYAPVYLSREDMPSVRIIGRVIWICRELS